MKTELDVKLLNELGIQKKAIEYIRDISEIDRYKVKISQDESR